MSESKKDDCPDASEPFTAYRAEVFVAEERAKLATADAKALGPKYERLSGARGRYETAWAAQKGPWEDVVCRLNRLAETLGTAVPETVREQLRVCWEETRAPETTPDCDEVDQWTCEKVEPMLSTVLDPSVEQDLLRVEALAVACRAARDTGFDARGSFPEGLAARVKKIDDAAKAVETGLAAPNADPRRAFVEYLAIRRDADRLEEELTTPTGYACDLKKRFVELLGTHRTTTCLTLAVAVAARRRELEEEAAKKKAENLVDLVLECAGRTPASYAQAGDRP